MHADMMCSPEQVGLNYPEGSIPAIMTRNGGFRSSLARLTPRELAMDLFPDVHSGLHSAETSFAGGVVIVDRVPVVGERNDVEPDASLKASLGDENWQRLCALVRRMWATMLKFCADNAATQGLPDSLAVLYGASAQRFGRQVPLGGVVMRAPHPSAYEYSHAGCLSAVPG